MKHEHRACTHCQLDAIITHLRGVELQLRALNRKETQMALDLTNVKDSVTAIVGAEASIRELVVQVDALVTAQGAKIQELIDAGGITDPDTLAALQAIADEANGTAVALNADRDALAAAVAANPLP